MGKDEETIQGTVEMTHIWGGYLRDIPRPHRREYSNRSKTRRPVSISIQKFDGIGIHYYVSIREADNPIRSLKEKVWRFAWDDKKGKGKVFINRFSTPEHAAEWIKEILKDNFPKTKYEIEYEDVDVKWLYREGD